MMTSLDVDLGRGRSSSSVKLTETPILRRHGDGTVGPAQCDLAESLKNSFRDVDTQTMSVTIFGRSRTMARPKYSITSDDVIHATQYLRTRLLTLTVKFDESVSPRAAQKEFEQAVDIRSKEDRANGVNAWCEKFLG